MVFEVNRNDTHLYHGVTDQRFFSLNISLQSCRLNYRIKNESEQQASCCGIYLLSRHYSGCFVVYVSFFFLLAYEAWGGFLRILLRSEKPKALWTMSRHFHTILNQSQAFLSNGTGTRFKLGLKKVPKRKCLGFFWVGRITRLTTGSEWNQRNEQMDF